MAANHPASYRDVASASPFRKLTISRSNALGIFIAQAPGIDWRSSRADQVSTYAEKCRLRIPDD
jgi:hypothetical protein